MDQEELSQLFEKQMFPNSAPNNVPEPGIPVQDIQVMSTGPVGGPSVMDDNEIDSILEQHIRNSSNWVGSEIAIQQANAMRFYLGLAEGELSAPPIQGRSSIVDTTVSDQIEWLMPALMEMFFASGNVVRFGPRKPGDEAGAKQMTALVNYIINEENPGFRVFQDWFKNALLNKVGVIKVWWEPYDETTRESYEGLTDDQLAVLSNDDDIIITTITSYVDPHAELAAMDQYRAQLKQFQMYQQAVALGVIPPPGAPAPNAPPAPGGLPPPPPPQNASSMPPGPPAGAPPMPPQAPQGTPPGPSTAPPPPPPLPVPKPPQPIDVSKLPQLHDVVMTRAQKKGRVAMEAMNPEDFLIEERSRWIEDGFSAHRLSRTLSELRVSGYANIDKIDLDDLASDQEALSVQNSEVMLVRESLQSIYKPQELTDYGDESQKRVWLYECYLPMDCDGDGIAEWRKITRAGNAILENVICDGPPFAALCPVPIPGLFYGRSIADLGMPLQLAKTGVLRAIVDNMNVQVNGRTWAIESQVNIDDLLTNRPGGVVRVKSPNSVGVLQQGMADAQGAYQLLEYLDTAAQEKTGITKYSQGLDADALNHTATGLENITARADLRTKLIARGFAEGGVKSLCKLIQKVLMQHQDQAMVFQLEGSWVTVDPRVWTNQYTMSVTVGLGTGDQGKKAAQLTQLMGIQQQLLPLGIATPQNIFNAATTLVESLQCGDPTQYFTLPQPHPPAAPPPDPNMVMVQGQLQIEAKKAQDAQDLAVLKAKMQQETDAANNQSKNQQAILHEQLLDKRTQDQSVIQMAWEREKFYAQLAATRDAAAEKAGVDAQTEVALNTAVVHDLNSQQIAQIPTEHLLAAQQMQNDNEAQQQQAASAANNGAGTTSS